MAGGLIPSQVMLLLVIASPASLSTSAQMTMKGAGCGYHCFAKWPEKVQKWDSSSAQRQKRGTVIELR